MATKRNRVTELKKNPHAGSTFDSFLKNEGIYDEVAARVMKRTLVHQLEKALKEKNKNKAYLRRMLGSPSTVDRLFSDHIGINLETLLKVAALLEFDLDVRLVKKKS